MTANQSAKVIVTFTVFSAIVLVAMFGGSPRVRADDSETALITRGFEIAPVPLNLAGRNYALVGLGSYLVNAVSDCNSCHNSGQPPDFDFAPGANPYNFIPGTNLSQPKKINPATYMGGGAIFGTADGGEPGPTDPLIIARNVTPDKTGRAAGGHTLAEFVQILRTGVDMDHVHPTLPGGANGKLLQIMPWPTFQNMTDHYLEAMYEYISAIPCLEGGPGEPENRCGTTGPSTKASASPKNATVTVRQIMLDGSGSTSADGRPLTYQWSIPQGNPSAAILQGSTATPTVQFGSARGVYTFQLTVTDSAGNSATDRATVNFQGY